MSGIGKGCLYYFYAGLVDRHSDLPAIAGTNTRGIEKGGL
jgi:hypothetical protein